MKEPSSYVEKRKVYRYFVVLLLSTLFSLPSFAGEVSARARIVPVEVEFGGTFQIVIEIERDQDDAITFPDPIPQNDKTRPVGKSTRVINNPKADRVSERLSIPMLALDFEDVKSPALVLKSARGKAIDIDSMPVSVKAPKENEGNAKKAGAKAEVKTPGALPCEPKAAKDFAYTAQNDWRPLYIILVLIFAFIVMFLVRRFLRLRSQRPQAQRPPAPVAKISAADLALQRLNALESEGLLERGEISAFVTRLMNEVFRFYIGQRFSIRAEQSTTRELAEILMSKRPQGLDATTLNQILDDADLVKFAKAQMQREVAEGSAQKVRAFIEEHRPKRSSNNADSNSEAAA